MSRRTSKTLKAVQTRYKQYFAQLYTIYQPFTQATTYT